MNKKFYEKSRAIHSAINALEDLVKIVDFNKEEKESFKEAVNQMIHTIYKYNVRHDPSYYDEVLKESIKGE